MLKSDTSNAVTKLHYEWDDQKLGFDRFNDLNRGISESADKYKVAVLGETALPVKQGDQTVNMVVTQENMSQFVNVIIIDKVNNKGHLFFETVAYSYYTIIMYKKDIKIKPSEANEQKYATVVEVDNT